MAAKKTKKAASARPKQKAASRPAATKTKAVKANKPAATKGKAQAKPRQAKAPATTPDWAKATRYVGRFTLA